MAKSVSETQSKGAMIEKTEQVGREVAQDPKVARGNGNNRQLDETKPGSAQRGGPGIEKARERQPPDATRTRDSEES